MSNRVLLMTIAGASLVLAAIHWKQRSSVREAVFPPEAARPQSAVPAQAEPSKPVKPAMTEVQRVRRDLMREKLAELAPRAHKLLADEGLIPKADRESSSIKDLREHLGEAIKLLDADSAGDRELERAGYALARIEYYSNGLEGMLGVLRGNAVKRTEYARRFEQVTARLRAVQAEAARHGVTDSDVGAFAATHGEYAKTFGANLELYVLDTARAQVQLLELQAGHAEEAVRRAGKRQAGAGIR